MNPIRCIQTPIGPLRIETDGQAVTRIRFGGDPNGNSSSEPNRDPNSDPNGDPNNGVDERADTPLLRQAVRELQEYFAGQRRSFTLPLAPAGTPFQHTVWEALRQIPYGQTRSYKQIAQQIGRPAACRAVGLANNRNPIPILIPCHRVVGADGSLTGYAGGLTVKSRLLAIERP